jgi:hypothetical protein
MTARGMVRKQIYLTTDQNARLRSAAKRLQRSEADLLREAIDRHLPGRRQAAPGVKDDSLFRLVGLASSKDGRLSARVDEILYAR